MFSSGLVFLPHPEFFLFWITRVYLVAVRFWVLNQRRYVPAYRYFLRYFFILALWFLLCHLGVLRLIPQLPQVQGNILIIPLVRITEYFFRLRSSVIRRQSLSRCRGPSKKVLQSLVLSRFWYRTVCQSYFLGTQYLIVPKSRCFSLTCILLTGLPHNFGPLVPDSTL